MRPKLEYFLKEGIERITAKAKLSRFNFLFQHLLSIRLCACHLTAFCLRFLTCYFIALLWTNSYTDLVLLL